MWIAPPLLQTSVLIPTKTNSLRKEKFCVTKFQAMKSSSPSCSQTKVEKQTVVRWKQKFCHAKNFAWRRFATKVFVTSNYKGQRYFVELTLRLQHCALVCIKVEVKTSLRYEKLWAMKDVVEKLGRNEICDIVFCFLVFFFSFFT